MRALQRLLVCHAAVDLLGMPPRELYSREHAFFGQEWHERQHASPAAATRDDHVLLLLLEHCPPCRGYPGAAPRLPFRRENIAPPPRAPAVSPVAA
ncbi:uncharacterized protein PG986_014492 [Apiospora aurea]|uniref:Uncharacterized protein n=2 Tax=Apiospora TaxID=1811811 RepID=A0ABR1SE21_9PEZI